MLYQLSWKKKKTGRKMDALGAGGSGGVGHSCQRLPSLRKPEVIFGAQKISMIL